MATHLQPMTIAEIAGWFDVASVSDLPQLGSAPKGIALSGLRIHATDGEWRCTATVDV